MAENIKIDLLINAAQSAKTIGETKKALKDLKSEALNLKEGSAAFTRIATAAGELQDKIGDLSATTKYLGDDLKNIKGITGIGEGIAGGFAMASGAAALFGGENKKLEESMVKLQAIMAVIQGMQAIGDVLQKQSAATLFIKNMMTKAAIALGYEEVAVKEAAVVVTGEEVAATVADTAAKGAKIVATEAEVVATKSATLGQKALNLAMKMNPIGILIALIIAGVSALMLWSDASNDAAEAEKKSNAEKKKAADLLKKQNEERDKAAQNIAKESTSYAMLIDRLRLTNAGSKERRDLIKEINSTYGATLKNMSDETAFQDQLNVSVDQYIAFKKDEYKLKTNEDKYTSALKEQTKAQDELNAALARQKEPKKKLLGIDTSISDAIAAAADQKIIDQSRAKIKEMDKWMAALTTSTRNTSAAMKDLGFNTEDAMGKGIDKTQEAIDKQNRLNDAVLKAQEDALKAKEKLSDFEKQQLKDTQKARIDIMTDGAEKQRALLDFDIKDKEDKAKKEAAAAIKEYQDTQEVLIKAKLANSEITKEQAQKELDALQTIEDTALLNRLKSRLGVDESAIKNKEELEGGIIFNIRKNLADRLAILEQEKKTELANIGTEAEKKSREDYNKWTKEQVDQLYKDDLQGINEQYAEKLKLAKGNQAAELKAYEEYTKQYNDLKEAKAKIDKYWEENARSLNSAYMVFENEEAEKQFKELNLKKANKLVSEEQYQKDLYAIIQKYGPPMLATVQKNQIYEIDAEGNRKAVLGKKVVYDTKLSFLENLVALYKKKYGQIGEIVHDENVKSMEEEDASNREKKEAKEKFWQEMLELEQAGQQLMMDIFMNAMAKREVTINKEYDAKMAKIGEEELAYENLQANRTIAEQQVYDIQQGFENQRVEAAKVRDMELDKVKKKQFDAQKANDIATIVIDTAIAVTKAVRSSPMSFGLPWSAILAGMGAVQVGMVASKKYVPSFATGGIFSGDGMVKGPGTGTSDSVNAKLSNGEVVINAKSTKMFAPILDAINQAGGGVAIPHLAKGGMFTTEGSYSVGPYFKHKHDIDMEALAAIINNRPVQVNVEATVSESSITTAQKSKQRLKGRTSF